MVNAAEELPLADYFVLSCCVVFYLAAQLMTSLGRQLPDRDGAHYRSRQGGFNC